MVTPKQFQILDLSVLREMPVSEVHKLLKVNPAQIYLARHRVGMLVRKKFEKTTHTAEVTVVLVVSSLSLLIPFGSPP